MGILQELQSHRVSCTFLTHKSGRIPCVTPAVASKTDDRTENLADGQHELPAVESLVEHTADIHMKATHLDTHAPRISTGGISDR
jgi:hypothetical protein